MTDRFLRLKVKPPWTDAQEAGCGRGKDERETNRPRSKLRRLRGGKPKPFIQLAIENNYHYNEII